jgi:hypothetical protein
LSITNRPFSVTAIATVTLVSSIIVILTFGLAELEFINTVFVAWIFLLEIYALIISILMFRYKSKYVWLASVSFWIIVIATSLVLSYSLLDSILVFFALPFIVASFVCLLLFNRETVRSYFGV